ncbi:uncharacterized protein LOC134286773 [Aedes albopictus]|uniref:Helix-turn-helix domain-containing protein n=1 Tax=Aedes albopictus TaxID=7160 RepID=A0ABM1Y8K4_AEDAL
MYESDYNTKMLELLSDTNTYKVIARDPTDGFQKKNNSIVDRLLALGLIDIATSYRLRAHSSQCPRIYGLPKVHKTNLPLRPVVPNIGAPSYMLSKYVGRILQASINSVYNITDSFVFYMVMEMLMTNVMAKINFPTPVIKKYVDDLILALPLDKVLEVLNVFNSYNPNIQFTHEVEQNGRLPFLDMVLVRLPDQSIKTEWYCKPMASGRFLDYLSSHPLHMKMNMVSNFIKRVRKLSTNLSQSEVDAIIDNHLKINHYPRPLRHRLINQRRDVADRRSSTNEEVMYKPMVFVPNLTNRLTKTFKTDFPNIMTAMRNEHTIKSLFTQTKDPIPKDQRNNVIYKIPCGDCDASYVGLTTTTLKKRIGHHRSDMTKLDRLMNDIENNNNDDNYNSYELGRLKERTALLLHSADNKHRFDLDRTEILDCHRRFSALPVLEVCHIINTDRTVNKRSDCDSLRN